MAGSRAASAREPGQIREEAALSDTARAPRASLAGADDRRARSRPGSGDGCTVRFSCPVQGKEAFRESIDEWLSVWESVAVETDHVEAYGDRVVARGAWKSTGRLSGVEGELPIHIVFTVRDGKIARVDWCADHEQAVAAARGA